MKLQVFDDLFAPNFLMDMYVSCLEDVSWGYQNTSNRYQYPLSSPIAKGRSNTFFGQRLYVRESPYRIENKAPSKFLDVIEHVVFQVIKDPTLQLLVIDCNLQIQGQDGDIHQDHFVGDNRDRTIMFYPHFEWKESWGGQLQILDDNRNVIEEYYPKPGRIIYFDSTVSHRGLGPSVPNVPRFSVAYRMGVNSDD